MRLKIFINYNASNNTSNNTSNNASNNEIHNGRYYELKAVNSEQNPKLVFIKKRNKYYTYCMMCVDTSNKKELIHWLVINYIKDDQQNIVIQYKPPNPLPNSGFHKYYVCLYEQCSKIDEFVVIQNNDDNGSSGSISNLNMTQFIKNNKLKCIESLMFETSYD